MTARRWLAVLAVALAVAGCAPSGPRFADAPLVLISIDTLRSDRLATYGYDGTATPHLDTLAADGVLFERAYAPVPLTLPSHVSVMTGRMPHRHGVRSNAGYPFDPEISLYLPRLLRAAGYRTGGFVSAYPLSRDAGFGADFDAFDDADGFSRQIAADVRLQRPGTETLAAARRWLAGLGEARTSTPLGLFVHLFEPHAPYEPPAFFARGVRHPYDGEVQAADHLVGLLLDELRQADLYDRALIVAFSDHGEGLGDHGEGEHGMLLYREALQVPLIVKLPGAAHAGTRVDAPVGLVDLLPTLAELLDLDLEADAAYGPDRLDGRSLVPLLTDDAAAAAFAERPLLAETVYPRMEMGWSELQSAIRGSSHYLHGPEPELFDLVADPRERDDRLDADRRTAGELRQVIREAEMAYTPPEAVSAEAEAALASLGYVGAAGATETLVDPRREIGVYETYRRGRQAWLDGDPETAVAYLRGTVSAAPELVDAWKLLAVALDRVGRVEEASEARRRVDQLTGSGG